jgi:hypothetical protein
MVQTRQGGLLGEPGGGRAENRGKGRHDERKREGVGEEGRGARAKEHRTEFRPTGLLRIHHDRNERQKQQDSDNGGNHRQGTAALSPSIAAQRRERGKASTGESCHG